MDRGLVAHFDSLDAFVDALGHCIIRGRFTRSLDAQKGGAEIRVVEDFTTIGWTGVKVAEKWQGMVDAELRIISIVAPPTGGDC